MRWLLTIWILMITSAVQAQQPVMFSGENILVSGKDVSWYADSSTQQDLHVVRSQSFHPYNKSLINLGYSNATLWLKLQVVNNSADSILFFQIDKTDLRDIKFYFPKNNQWVFFKSGTNYAFNERAYPHQTSVFKLPIKPGAEKTVYLSFRSNHQLLIPLYIGNEKGISKKLYRFDLILSFYLGIVSVMLLYNLFIYFTVHDRSYLYYVFYIFSVGLAQVCLNGLGDRWFWNGHPLLADFSIIIAGILSALGVALFFWYFLNLKEHLPRFKRFVVAIFGMEAIALMLALSGYYRLSFDVVNFVAMAGGLLFFFTALYLAVKGLRAARFFIIAWSIFLVSVVVFSLKSFGIIPVNLFTDSILLLGSAIEFILLSFSLADSINILKMEKAKSQQDAINFLKENERIIREQNIILEQKVNERTNELSDALKRVQETQMQLVESEKMASLGQLTAGIAHEINNPINFVKSNVNPIKLDIDDLIAIIDAYSALDGVADEKLRAGLQSVQRLKTEIDLDFIKEELKDLLKGIEDGASRTAEIVKGLRTFSRLDEGEIKTVDIHEGIDSTLIILRSTFLPNIKVEKHYGISRKIECYPGKLNQVFMNIISNSVQAIGSKRELNEEEFIRISTRDVDENNVEISIADSGPGMSDEVMHKIFDPFFTTKEVGEGTGLGMAIVFKIIEQHKGKIEVVSEVGKGAAFIITLPLQL